MKLTRDEWERIEKARRDEIMKLPPFTLIRIGWLTPSGRVQGRIFYRVGPGLEPTVGRDNRGPAVRLATAVFGDYDKTWAIEILAVPPDERIPPIIVTSLLPGATPE